jgi:signal transduction histidine kinase
VTPPDRARRTRRIWLLLSAILIPTTVVVLLVVRVVRQDHELSERRAAEQRREALDQLRRELSARLQAIRLEEVNRLIGGSGMRLPPDSPIVFVAPMAQDRMILPWDDGAPSPAASPAVARYQREGESLEFQRRDAAAAAASYDRALAAARTPSERCAARISLGRAYLKAHDGAGAERTDLATLHDCAGVVDGDGVAMALYAAARLADTGRHEPAIAGYAVHRVFEQRWHSPAEAYGLQALLRGLRTPASRETSQRLSLEIHNIEQVAALARDLHDHPATLQRAARTAPGDLSWMGYGDEPWLVTLVSPSSFAAPVVMAVSSRRILPAGVMLRADPAPGAGALGDGFVNLQVSWPPGRFTSAGGVPVVVYASILAVVLGAVLLAGYLVLRDVHRESETAELRSHFVASVSHELKTPLTSIRAHAETLLMGRSSGPETTAEYLKTIVSESERLSRLVDSVLEFSRIEQGRKTYQMHVVPLDDVVRAAARTMEYALAQLGFTLVIDSDGTHPTVLGDPEALTQAILNLLGNAVKYSGDARRIEMRIGTRGNDAFVEVVDHGIGIARDDQSRIFERFHRVQSPQTAGIAGAGLGLALVLHVVEAHRGRIAVVSDVGRGSTFSVNFPVQGLA